ncbi:MAG TPA: signal peptidase II [Longimicrobiaceae bacterium]|nr:signal peptidase II [Longimicrobiaceae bacterium]
MTETRETPHPTILPEPTMRGKVGLYAGVVGGVLVLDIITKYVVQRTLRLYDPVPVLGDFFRLTYIFNRGAAFGLSLGEHSRWIFTVLTVLAVIGLFLWYRSTPSEDRTRLFALASVTGGAIGNLIDRIRSHQGVVDFLDIGFGDLRWPVFNVADIAVTCGAVLLAISLWREDVQAARDRDGG